MKAEDQRQPIKWPPLMYGKAWYGGTGREEEALEVKLRQAREDAAYKRRSKHG